ncbi:hypothetical protein [Lewinella sp. W8]|uniref:hypothetical protein n=1 Tax=Lewinella sp. W8 TaxID=2528208 RepID=UPI00106869B0|nr:hypothetical protein [Lewinella sp. W8]MTB50165.1 hypothetical protein [Lewinella sp. W8]
MTKERIGMILWGMAGLALFASGIFKLLQAEEVVAMLGDNTLYVGIIEVLAVIALFVPATRKLGFFLCASYLGGVIATEWIHLGGAPIPGLVLSTMLYLGINLYDPSLMGNLLGGKSE